MAKKIIYYNADIVTMDEKHPSADAILIQDGKVAAVGTKKDVFQAGGNAEKIDMKGKVILPGFIDGHSHMISNSYDLMFANANPAPKGKCNSIDQLISELQKQFKAWLPTRKKNQWYICMGYDNSAYEDGNPPTKYDLDKISTEVPICVTHASGHCAVLNTLALQQCSIDDQTVAPEGGAIPKFPNSNEITGLLQEKAFFDISKCMVAPGLMQVIDAIGKSVDMYMSYGITTAQDAKTMMKDMAVISIAKLFHKFKIDVVCYIDYNACEKYLPKQDPHLNPYKGHVRYAGYKLFLDGSPQAKTAWLTKPYYVVPEGKDADYCGFPSLTDEEVLKHCETCLKNNWQINVHTNGDAAIDQLIRCYKKAMEKYPNAMDLRPVSIHCQTVRQDQLDEMKKMGMLISFFCDHVYYWGDYHYSSVLGPERADQISPVHSAMIDRGINCTLHQDTPVVNPNVLFAVHNAVNRKTMKGRVLGENQKISVYDALKCVTVNGAYQIFEEHTKGNLVVGKAGDLVVLNKNPLKVDPTTIKDIQVLETIKAGKTVFKK